MLVLTRKSGEQVVVGTNIVITVTEIGGGRVKLGIEAPRNVTILRGELEDDQDVEAFRSQWVEADQAKPVATSSSVAGAAIEASGIGSAGSAVRGNPLPHASTRNPQRRLRKIPR